MDNTLPPMSLTITGFDPHYRQGDVIHPVPPEFIANLRIPRSVDDRKCAALTIVESWDKAAATAIAWSFLSVHSEQDSLTPVIHETKYDFCINLTPVL